MQAKNSEKTNHNIFYILPNIQRRNLSLRKFYHAIKSGAGWEHFKTFWLNIHKPVGGIKVIYQHCMLLKELGFSCYPLRMGKYEGDFFGFQVQSKKIETVGYELTNNDVIVCPEHLPYLGLEFKNAKKYIFIQNWRFIYNNFNEIDKHKSYRELGYEGIICCGTYIRDLLVRDLDSDITVINNFIDLEKFKPNESVKKNIEVLALTRKNPNDLKEIRKLVGPKAKFSFADRLTQDEIIEKYQRADIFLATGYPEGFGLPPLEAMACGAAVVGFTGGGAREYMVDGDTALVAEDGDVSSAAKKLIDLVEDREKKENIRQAGFEIAATYTAARTKLQLNKLFTTIVSGGGQ